ncbi:alanyl-tRNA editing protein [Pseudomonas daroniae]|uniref:Alanyl-tRNA editing protein n=1 Tax=Phytopseudomonas daroniae TaxID=2487519 RepID=A0A4Q9QSB9_9GAMM|nr:MULTISPECIES: alanyl-tRNA editing protein [Pseudomonas]TBU83440.1 alanyl-tRNA editing protein [Pseudomonas daroniae]TBU85079.1 alanyl-tRNA editing protein [Pseudomonas sp. FRB 228]TBU93628.1 alanyl-tRNA editing protein [Pseudomonas daroniae]
MMDKVFWQDPYQTQLVTRVAQVIRDEVSLEATIFFAFSGGQESDTGTLAGLPVLQARKHGLDIFYLLPSGHGLKVGDEVALLIDWVRRQRLMRLHFAAEMVLQLVCQLHPGIQRIGAHIAQDKARIDFALDANIGALFSRIEAQAAQLVAENRPIICEFTDVAAQRRLWRVDGFAQMPCGGTHPRTTGEVGSIRLKRKNIGKGKERVEVYLVEDRKIVQDTVALTA